jgi:hypothetical protein
MNLDNFKSCNLVSHDSGLVFAPHVMSVAGEVLHGLQDSYLWFATARMGPEVCCCSALRIGVVILDGRWVFLGAGEVV